MALVIAGRIAPIAKGNEDETFAGRVWIDDDGNIDRVTRRGAPAPPGFTDAPVVDVGSDAVVYPGFVDLHSHLAYNSLPLWAEDGEPHPYLHRDIWPGRPTYKTDVAWPAWSLMNAAPESVYAYVQVRALAGGTTAIQGWPMASRPPSNRLVRSIDDDQVGPLEDPTSVSVLTLPKAEIRERERDVLDTGRSFIYHLAEGQRGSIVAKELDDMSGATWSALQPGLDRDPLLRTRGRRLRDVEVPGRTSSRDDRGHSRVVAVLEPVALRLDDVGPRRARVEGRRRARHRLGTVGHEEPARRDQGRAPLERSRAVGPGRRRPRPHDHVGTG